MEDRAGVSDVQNPYFYRHQHQRVPLWKFQTQTEMAIPDQRRLFRTVTVSAFPSRSLASEVRTPSCHKSGVREKAASGIFSRVGVGTTSRKGLRTAPVVMAISVALIHRAGAAVPECYQAVLVFAAIPTDGRRLGHPGRHGRVRIRRSGARASWRLVRHVSCLDSREAHERASRWRGRCSMPGSCGCAGDDPVAHRCWARPLAMHADAIGATVLRPDRCSHSHVLRCCWCLYLSIFVLDLKLIRWEREAPAPASVEVSTASVPAA